jgi:hypothetical protein
LDDTRFYAPFATDRNLSTAWVEGSPPETESTEAGPRGEWIRLEFDNAVDVRTIRVANGYCRSDGLGDRWRQYKRVRQIMIETENAPSAKRILDDVRYLQTVSVTASRTHWVKLSILSVYEEGVRKQANAAISELEVWGRRL